MNARRPRKTREKTEKEFITAGEAAQLSGLEIQTIRRLIDSKKISGFTTPAGHRRISRKSLQGMLHNDSLSVQVETCERENFLYTRVSTKKQMDDLSRQIEFVSRPEYSSYNLISDIGSGINFKRKGLQSLLDSCLRNRIGEVVVAYRDRLCRFGFELIESLINKAGGKITIIGPQNEEVDESKELADDLLAIVTIFSCRQMGRRSYKNRKSETKDDKSKDLPNKTTTSSAE
jgi:excisionase family DNA binding protein